MSRASATARGRRAAEDGMTDTCVITRPDPDGAPAEMDPETGQYPESARLTVYEGKCRVQIASVMGDASTVNAGERDGTTQGSVLQLPVLESTDVAADDVVMMTAVTHDPSLVDRQFTITGRHGKSQATARRLRVIEVTA